MKRQTAEQQKDRMPRKDNDALDLLKVEQEIFELKKENKEIVKSLEEKLHKRTN